MPIMEEPADVLEHYWGFREFRPLQREIIADVLAGKDTLALLPTGGGKSVCFQVPALCMEGICLVITPLISLMKDQVEQLQKKGIAAVAIFAGMPWQAVEKAFRDAVRGDIKFLYLSPERLQTRLFSDYLRDLPLSLITVDEAHCISHWGYDFRPAYLKIGSLRQLVPDVPILALTATATRRVREDIMQQLGFRSPNERASGFCRPNLAYSVIRESSKHTRIAELLSGSEGSAIVFTRSRRRAQEIAQMLSASGMSADFYHAGLDMEDRTRKQEAWMKGEIRIMCCTNAFGMGIDKPDVRMVIHADMAENPEAYYQEAGRAGRDGKMSRAVLLYNDQDVRWLEDGIKLRYPSMEKIREVYHDLVSFLGVPAGSGEGMSFDFELEKFTQVFGQHIVLVASVLRLLEQEGILIYQEQSFTPAKATFRTTKQELYLFQENNAVLEPIINALLRTYERIFDYYVPITETKLANVLKSDVITVVRQLKDLKAFRIIDYRPKKEKPQLVFLEERIIVSHLQLNEARILERKEIYTKGIMAMIAYATNQLVCRSKMLTTYLDDEDPKDCEICDICQS